MTARYALVGAGSRAQMYLEAIAGPHADVAELVAWSDPNPGRLDWSERALAAAGIPAPARFAPSELGEAVRRHRIDRVIVTAPDFAHAGLVVAALEAGADAIVEKPLTTDEAGVRMIAEAAERTGRDVVVTFNYRYSPRNSALKRVIASGEIGEVTSVHFEWVLDTAHGADYFRRWHRVKENSGGLLVHKSSHHFDLVNWWLADAPARVFASGGLRFYGAENARRRGLGPRAERGSVDSPLRDAFSLDLREDPTLRGLYFEQEAHDGYLRDRDVFDDGITIEDNLALIVDYARGATMSYSLNAHSPWEGYTVAVNGTAGRAELSVVERGAVVTRGADRPVVDPSAKPERAASASADGAAPDGAARDAAARDGAAPDAGAPDGAAPDAGARGSAPARPTGERLLVQRHFEEARVVPIPMGAGSHGGGDAVMLRDLFVGPGEDPLGRAAGWRDGAAAVSVGLAGNRSLDTGRAIPIAELSLSAVDAVARPA